MAADAAASVDIRSFVLLSLLFFSLRLQHFSRVCAIGCVLYGKCSPRWCAVKHQQCHWIESERRQDWFEAWLKMIMKPHTHTHTGNSSSSNITFDSIVCSYARARVCVVCTNVPKKNAIEKESTRTRTRWRRWTEENETGVTIDKKNNWKGKWSEEKSISFSFLFVCVCAACLHDCLLTFFLSSYHSFSAFNSLSLCALIPLHLTSNLTFRFVCSPLFDYIIWARIYTYKDR